MAALPPPPPPNPLAVALPAPPNDPNVPMPAAPHFPPTVNNVIRARRYRQDVSFAQQPDDGACTPNDLYNSIIYEHSVVAQAAAAAGPQAPPWFQAAIQQLRDEIQQLRNDTIPDIKRLINNGRRDGTIVDFDIVPFTNGDDPTLEPHNLPPLHSVNDIQRLNGQTLAAYLIGYGIEPAFTRHPHELQKETLKRLVGALRRQ